MSLIDLLGGIACLLLVTATTRSFALGRADPAPSGASIYRGVALLGLGLLSASSSFAIAYGPAFLRVPVAATLLLVVPGLTIVVSWGVADRFDELALSLALSLAVLVASGTIMVTVRMWEPVLFGALLSVVTAPVLAWHGARAWRPMLVGRAGRDVR